MTGYHDLILIQGLDFGTFVLSLNWSALNMCIALSHVWKEEDCARVLIDCHICSKISDGLKPVDLPRPGVSYGQVGINWFQVLIGTGQNGASMSIYMALIHWE